MSFGLLFPFAMCYKQKWIAKHTVINCKKLVFNGKALSIICHYLLWCLLSVITFGIYGIWLPMKIYGWQVKNTHIKLKEEEYEKSSKLPIIIAIVFGVLMIILLSVIIPKLEIPKLLSGDKEIKDIFVKKDKDNLNEVQSSLNPIIYDNKRNDDITTKVESDVNIDSAGNNEATNKSNDTIIKPTTKCNSGYVFNSFDDMCYSLNDYVDPITDCSDPEAACSVTCEDGYMISWEVELGLEGFCYKIVNPNY